MRRKYIIWIITALAGLIVLLFVIGINIGKDSIIPSPSPTPYKTPEIEQASLPTTIPHREEKFTIMLQENTLTLYEGDKKINETEIASHVLPSTDIKALKSGLSYLSLEDALIDWESLCK